MSGVILRPATRRALARAADKVARGEEWSLCIAVCWTTDRAVRPAAWQARLDLSRALNEVFHGGVLVREDNDVDAEREARLMGAAWLLALSSAEIADIAESLETATIPAPNNVGRYPDGSRWRAWWEGARPDGVRYEYYDAADRVTFRLWYDGRTESYPDPETTDG